MQRKSDSARLGSQVFKIVTSPFEPLWKLSKPLHCISTTHVIVFVRARARACESNQILSRESESVGPPAAPAGHQGAPLTVPPAKIRFSKKGRRVRVTLLVGGERPSAWWLVPCGPPWRLLAVTVLGNPPLPPRPSHHPGKCTLAIRAVESESRRPVLQVTLLSGPSLSRKGQAGPSHHSIRRRSESPCPVRVSRFGPQPGLGFHGDPGTDSDTYPGTDSDTYPGTDSETDSETDAETDSETDSEITRRLTRPFRPKRCD